MITEQMIAAWKAAGNDLNINIRSPLYITTAKNRTVKFDLLVESFGSPKGIVLMSLSSIHNLRTIKQHGFVFSALNYKSYSIYDRQFFIDTLNDWGYFGDLSNTPDWYTGQPWTK